MWRYHSVYLPRGPTGVLSKQVGHIQDDVEEQDDDLGQHRHPLWQDFHFPPHLRSRQWRVDLYLAIEARKVTCFKQYVSPSKGPHKGPTNAGGWQSSPILMPVKLLLWYLFWIRLGKMVCKSVHQWQKISPFLSIISTWAFLLAAQKTNFSVTVQIVPLETFFPRDGQATFIPFIVWFSWSPEYDLGPGSAVNPLPNALLLNIIASNPDLS